MRYIYLFLITFLFAACGNQHLRFVRTKTHKQKVVEIAEIPSLKKTVVASEQSATSSSTEETSVYEARESINTDESSEIEHQEIISTSEEAEDFLPAAAEDSTTISKEEVDEITQEALRAEKLGTRSLTASLLAPLLALVTVIILIFAVYGNLGPAIVIGSIVLAVLSLTSSILGLIFGIKSLRAPYNTRKGRKRAVAGIVISSVFLGLFLLNFAIGFF